MKSNAFVAILFITLKYLGKYNAVLVSLNFLFGFIIKKCQKKGGQIVVKNLICITIWNFPQGKILKLKIKRATRKKSKIIQKVNHFPSLANHIRAKKIKQLKTDLKQKAISQNKTVSKV